MRTLFKQVQGEVPGSPIFIMKVASQVITDSNTFFRLFCCLLLLRLSILSASVWSSLFLKAFGLFFRCRADIWRFSCSVINMVMWQHCTVEIAVFKGGTKRLALTILGIHPILGLCIVLCRSFLYIMNNIY